MMLNHKFSLDLQEPSCPDRITVKQGDTLTHGLTVDLFSGGEPWMIPEDTVPLVRWFACDPDSGESARGIFDTLPNGSRAWNCAQNQLDLVLAPQMFALPGIVQADVAFVQGEKILATANFQFYVNRAPADGAEPQAQDFYRVATLEQINAAIGALEEWKEGADRLLAHLEQQVDELNRIVNGL